MHPGLAAIGVATIVLHNPMVFPAEMLEAHNQARAAAGVPPLVWDEALSTEAEAYAKQLAASGQFRHSGAEGQGENLWRGTRSAFSYRQMARAWTAEAAYYRHGPFPDVSATGRWQDVGHYTQLVWRDTTRLGCGLASGRQWDVLVCRYAPQGNWIGRRAY